MVEEEDFRKIIEGFKKEVHKLVVSGTRLGGVVHDLRESLRTGTIESKGVREDTKELEKLAKPVIEGIEQLRKWWDTK